MFVSIIVPVYNVCAYITTCIQSLIEQDIDDYEIILIDDGSTDGSSEICDELSKKYTKVIVYHKRNGGLSDARNYGLKKATGRYVLFVDSDDYVQKNCLAALKSACIKQNSPDLMFLKAEKVYADGRYEPIDLSFNYTLISTFKQKYDVLSYLANLNKYPGSAWTKLVSRELLLTHNIFFDYGRYSEDLDWTRRIIFSANTFGGYEGNYYYYRQNRPGAITSFMNLKKFSDLCYVVETWCKDATHLDALQRQVLYKFSCYEYKILLADFYFLDNKARKEIISWLEGHKWLLKYNKSNSQIKMIDLLMSIIGINCTCYLLNLFLKLRNKMAAIKQ